MLLGARAAATLLRSAEGLATSVGGGLLLPRDLVQPLAVFALLLAVAGWLMTKNRAEGLPFRVRVPVSGLIPLTIARATVGVLAVLGSIGIWVPSFLGWLLAGSPRAWLELAFVLLLTPLLGLNFHRPRDLAAALGDPALSPERVRGALKRSIWRSVVLLGSIFAVALVGRRTLGEKVAPDPYAALILLAVAADLGAEWSARRAHGALVEAGSLQSTWRADLVAARCAEARIPVHLGGACHRSLLRPLGPFIPIRVYTPLVHRAQVSALITQAQSEAR